MDFDLPEKARLDRFFAKQKLYDRALMNTKSKDQLQNLVKKITWKYVLSEKSIGVIGTKKVEEIQIFELELKEQEIPRNALRIIDRSIPFPILYIFKHNEHFAYGISLLEESGTYYFSEWDEEMNFDFSGLNLETIYQNIIKQFITDIEIEDKDFDKIIEIDQKVKSLENEIEALENKIKREKQFNRKVELNKILHEKRRKLENCKL